MIFFFWGGGVLSISPNRLWALLNVFIVVNTSLIWCLCISCLSGSVGPFSKPRRSTSPPFFIFFPPNISTYEFCFESLLAFKYIIDFSNSGPLSTEKFPSGLIYEIIFSLWQAKFIFEALSSRHAFPLRKSVSFFRPLINRLIKRPPNSFLPTQKNCSESSEYPIPLVSSIANLFTVSRNRLNDILSRGYLSSCTWWKKLRIASVCRFFSNVSKTLSEIMNPSFVFELESSKHWNSSANESSAV